MIKKNNFYWYGNIKKYYKIIFLIIMIGFINLEVIHNLRRQYFPNILYLETIFQIVTFPSNHMSSKEYWSFI